MYVIAYIYLKKGKEEGKETSFTLSHIASNMIKEIELTFKMVALTFAVSAMPLRGHNGVERKNG